MRADVPARVTLVTLGVADVARATAFFVSLGWRTSGASQTGDVTFFHTGGPVVALYGWDALAEDARVSAGGSGFRGFSVAINLESPAAVDAAVRAWVEAGGTLVKAPELVFWGGYSGYVADLDGHLWELAHNPGFPLRADGSVQLPD
jgi:uncharacterized protein